MKRFLPVPVIIIGFIVLTVCAQQDNFPELTRFNDSSNHWYNIFDDVRVIHPLPNQGRYSALEYVKIADNILLFQKDNGGWAKNYDMCTILTKSQKDSVLQSKSMLNTTFDNGTTHSQLTYLAEVYTLTKEEKYKSAFLKGIDFALKAQYTNGGWPQRFPDTSGYQKYITFNDGAMVGIMLMLQKIVNCDSNYNFLDYPTRETANAAYDKGIACILNCQITENGKKLAWCQQHDNITLKPRDARTFEKESICNAESVGILNILMGVKKPSKEIVHAVDSAVEWFEESEIHGIRLEWFESDEQKFIYHSTNMDCRIIVDENAPRIWARFYELETHRPIFCGRDGIVKYSMSEIDRDRRTGYRWYVYAPEQVLEYYPEWKEMLTR